MKMNTVVGLNGNSHQRRKAYRVLARKYGEAILARIDKHGYDGLKTAVRIQG